MFCCFNCGLWTSKCKLGSFSRFATRASSYVSLVMKQNSAKMWKTLQVFCSGLSESLPLYFYVFEYTRELPKMTVFLEKRKISS